MSIVNERIPRDPQGVPLPAPDWGFQAEKKITFAGGTANAIGDHDGTADPTTIFTVTGSVKIRVFAVVETTLVGAATIELGATGATAIILPQVADASGMAKGEIWHMTDGTVDAKIEAITVSPEKILADGADMIMTLGTANITAGVLRFVCHWYPLTKNASVVASTA